MRIFLLSFCLSVISIFASGQKFTVDKDTVLRSGSAAYPEIICYNIIDNNTTDTLLLKWVRIEKTLPAGWKTQVCDLNACYFFDVSTNTFQLLPSSSSNIDLHFWPEDVPGTGDVEILLFVVGDSANTVHSSYYKATANPVGINDLRDINITIKPNPVKDVFSLNGLDIIKDVKVQIFDLLGNKLELKIDLAQPYVNVVDLPKGYYFLQLRSENYSFLKTIRFEKL